MTKNEVIHLFCQDKKTAILKINDIKNIMIKKSQRNHTQLDCKEELSTRIARLRKERGYTQAELAKEVGTTREVVSDYERGKIRPHYKMIIQFAMTFKVTTDELLGLKISKQNESMPSLKLQRRMKKIESLPPSQQRTLLKTIDTFLKGAQI